MNPRIRYLAAAAGAGILVHFLLLRGGSDALKQPPATPSAVATTEGAVAAAAEATPAGRPVEGRPSDPRAPHVTYAVPATELSGLPLSAGPGTRLDVWVAWEPPITKLPDIRRLLSDVTLDEIAPPVLPEGPHVALLLVKPRQVRDLLYGDRYGALSVTMKPQ